MTYQNYDAAASYDCAYLNFIPNPAQVTQSSTLPGASGPEPVDDKVDLAAISNYKPFIDKHVRKFLNYKREIGTVLHIRNVTAGLVISGNTFEQNIGTGGVNLLVEGFSNTISTSIIIDSNTFADNFAYHFAPSFAIIKTNRDLVTMDCVGVTV